MTAAPEAGELLLEVSPGTLQPLVVERDDVRRLLDLQGELAAAGKQIAGGTSSYGAALASTAQL